MGRLALVIVIVTAVACAKGGGNEPPAVDSPPPPVDVFVPPDMDNGCATQPCSILPQCGCASTDACDIDFSDGSGTACRVINTPGQITSTCDAASKCDRGFVCLGGSNAICKKYCSTDADCGSPRGQCVLDITSGGQPIPGIPAACSSNCDPVATGTTFCPTNFKCNIFVANHAGQQKNIVDCSPAGAGKQGANCKANNVGVDTLCAPNFSCTTIDGGTNFNCRHFCNKTANTGCPSGTTCISFNPAFTIKGTEFGVCN